MRPIKLIVQGINSFTNEDKKYGTIDFEKLTSRGLFGIFGPTGSGKSTILDGITLALYGKTSRKSSNYINSNCDTASVSFEFEISGTTKCRYRVERGFKRNKEGGINTSGAKFFDTTNGELLLEEGVDPVNKKSEEIIGLNIDDFTRTVVLPQGKFSEFLRLSGKDRNNMLERLFNLKEYGDELSQKLSNEKVKQKNKQKLLEGQCKGYEDISEELLEEKSNKAKEVNKSLNKAKVELENIKRNFKESEEVWNLQLELKGKEYEKNKLKLEEEDIRKKNEKVKLGERALKVRPYIDSYEVTFEQHELNENNLEHLTKNLNKLKFEKEEIEKNLIIVTNKKDIDLPELKLKKQRIKDAIEEKKALDIIIDEIKKHKNKINELKNKIDEDNIKLKESDEKINAKKNELQLKEEIHENLKIEYGLKEKVQNGLLLDEKYKSTLKGVRDYQDKIENINSELEKLDKENDKIKEEKDKKEKFLKSKNNELEKLIKNSPGKSSDLLNLQEKLNNLSGTWSRYHEYTSDIEEAENRLEQLEKTLKEENYKKEHKEIDLKELQKQLKEMQMEQLAYKLRIELKENNPCPVCGSLEHNEYNLVEIDTSEIDNMEKEIHKKEKDLKEIETTIVRSKTKYDNEIKIIDLKKIEIEMLGEEFKNTPVNIVQDEFNNLKKDIEAYENQKENLENLISVSKEDYSNIEKYLNNILIKKQERNKSLQDTQLEYETKIYELKDIEINLNNLKLEIKVEDFANKNKEIRKKEEEREALSNDIKILRNELEILDKNKKAITSDANISKEELAKTQAILDAKEISKEEKLNSIKSKVDDYSNLEQSLSSVEVKVNKIEEEFKSIQQQKRKVDESYQEKDKEYTTIITKKKELEKRLNLDKKRLEESLKEEKFDNLEDVRSNIISKEIIEKIKVDIEEYNKNLNKVIGAIESTVKKINNRKIREEEWEDIKRSKLQKENDIDSLSETKIKLEKEVIDIETKLKKLIELENDKKKIDHKLGILNELDTLFKGKKFVEYVATNRLKYISIEASKILKDITNGTYGLEIDANGRFIIRDYKNGGAQRDASTLSGGETFLASLALALALSTEIQLKGTAPLELFFLDEGFGTLDEGLLDVVMSSFEKIHNDKLKVGIISHVESIKDRVPVKLIVTPSEAGKGGSKVNIEYS